MNPTAQQPRSESPGLSHPQKFPLSPPSLFPLFRNLAPAANGPPPRQHPRNLPRRWRGRHRPTFAADYYPYGKILRQFSCQPNRYLSTHHERDAETGYDNRGARLYDAEIGRFLGVDPLASSFEPWSPYHYVLGNPISLVDPNGEEAVEADCCPPDYSLGFAYMHYGKKGMENNLKGKYYAAGGAITGAAVLATGALAPAAGTNYAKKMLTNIAMEAVESLVFSENHDLSDIDYFDALNPIKGFGGNLTNAIINVDENGPSINNAKDGMIELVAGETGRFISGKLQKKGAELLKKSESIDNYQRLFPAVNPSTGRRNFALSVSRRAQQVSDASAGAGLLRRGSTQGTVAGVIMENIAKSF